MTSSPKLTTDQLLRIEALKVAHDSGASTYGPPAPNFVVDRANAYLAFLNAASSPDSPKPSSAKRKK